MDCETIKKLLDQYLEGELEGEKFAAVESHIARCDACRAELDRRLKMRQLLRELKEVEVSEGEREEFIRALMSRIEAERAKGLPGRRARYPILAASIAVVATLIVILLLPPKGNSTIKPAPGLNAIQNAMADILIMSALDDHFVATQADFMADQEIVRGRVLSGWKIIKDSHAELLKPVE